MKRIMSMLVVVVMFSGCSTFTPPIEWPVFEQHAKGRVNTFSVIPSRRMVIVKSDDPGNPKEKKILICAEATADVTDNLTSALAASLSVSKVGAADAAASVSKVLETSAQFLFKRTQGIQLYRDGMYHLCQARMNGFITDQEYVGRAADLLEKVIPLIQIELPLLQPSLPASASSNPGKPAVDAKAGKSSVSIAKDGGEAKAETDESKPDERPKDDRGTKVPPA